LLAVLVLIGLAAGCRSTSTIYSPVDAYDLRGRSLLILEASPQPPLPDPVLMETLAHIEQGLLASPYVARVVSRAAFQQSNATDFALRGDYARFSDTVAVVGFAEREQSQRLGRHEGVDLLVSAQAFYTPCGVCEHGDQVAVVLQLVQAETATLQWRATLTAPVGKSQDDVALAVRELAENVLTALHESIGPKWHRERFRNLSRTAAPTPGPAPAPRAG
jgi:hypothetical protein